MEESIYLDVLRRIYIRLQYTNINWVLTGSLAFALQGMPVLPHDIDLQTDEAGAYTLENIFSECVIKPVAFSSTENICSHFGKLVIDGIDVEIMGDVQKRLVDSTWEAPVDLYRHKRFVDIEGMRLPVLSLEYEYQAYMKLGRVEKAHIIKQALFGTNRNGE